MTKLEELKAALEAGDTVQWEYFVQTETDDGESYPFGYVRIAAHRYASSEGTTMEKAVNNTAFIALAHNLMPTLLEAVGLLETVSSARACQDHEFDVDAWFKQVRRLLGDLK